MAIATSTLKSAAITLGFNGIGVTSATPLEDHAFYKEWLLAGLGGEMGYLRDHAPLKSDPNTLLPDAKTVICVRANYSPEPLPDVRVARYALGRDYHKVLRRKLKKLVSQVESDHPGSRHRICVDSAPILERSYAHRAGLGWFGKNTCLIDSKTGSWFFLACVLSTIEFTVDEPAEGQCGTCRACIDACPTGAIVSLQGRWAVDSRRCISYLTIEKKGESTEEEPSHDGWVFGCDICQEVCPFNKPRSHHPLRAQPPSMPEFLPRHELKLLATATSLSEEQWSILTEGTALRRAGINGMNRNLRAIRQSSAQ